MATIYKSKKSQFLVLSSMILLGLLLFIYSEETQNTYITSSSKLSLLENIKHEVCEVGKRSNGTFIDSRFTNITINISSYCSDFGFVCNVTIDKESEAPVDLTFLNYTYYNYSIEYVNNGFNSTRRFTC